MKRMTASSFYCLFFPPLEFFKSQFFALVAITLLLPQVGLTLTLTEAYQSAVKNTSTVKNSSLNIEKSQNLSDQQLSLIFPKLSLSSQSTWEDDPSDVTSSSLENYGHSAKVSLEQPLFLGGAEYQAFRLGGLATDLADWENKQTQSTLYYNVGTSFYDVMILESEKTHLLEQQKILQERVEYISGRTKIGRSKHTELLASQSQLARISADLEFNNGSLIKAKQRLKEITGLTSIEKLEDTLPIQNISLLEKVNRVKSTPQIESQRIRTEVLEREASALSSTYFPTVKLSGNYYLDRDDPLSEQKWDMGIYATWELFSGGGGESKRRIKAIEAEQARLSLNDEERNYKLRITSTFDRFESERKQSLLLEQASKLAQTSYREHQKEFRNGLVGNLDVLRALDDYLVIQRTYDRNRFNTKKTYLELLQLLGETP